MNALIHKPTSQRRTRPAWATNDKQLMERCVGKRGMIRFKIAQMYWRQNMSAKDIATALGMTVNAVYLVLNKLSK